jgi:transcriptional regulator with XRE-family HTH domain
MTECEWLREFAENLSGLMFDREFTQSKLAEETGLTQASISHYVNGKQIPTLRAIVNMAYALDVTTDDLIDFGSTIE